MKRLMVLGSRLVSLASSRLAGFALFCCPVAVPGGPVLGVRFSWARVR
jgi:hypothetical protein